MPFHDLSIAYNADHAALSNTLLFAKELGYTTVAISIAITGELPSPLPTIPISNIPNPSKLNLLTRLTITISDTSQNFRLGSLTPNYDIIALRPTTEKALQQCCLNLECDIISLDFSQRLHFPLRFTTASSALQRGIRFEICYSSGIVAGSDARRNLISGATQLIRATRGKGLIISSEAKSALGLRAPWDVINLAQVWGMPQQRAKEGVCEEVGKTVRLAGMKRTSYRGVVDIIDGGNQTGAVAQGKAQAPVQKTSVGKISQQQRGLEKHKDSAQVTTANSAKRKASAVSLTTAQPKDYQDDKPSEKRGKKRAKKVRVERNTAVDPATENASESFLLQHESLMPLKPK